MRISDWSSDVCSSDLLVHRQGHVPSPEDEDRQRQPGRERAERIDLKRVEPRQADRRGIERRARSQLRQRDQAEQCQHHHLKTHQNVLDRLGGIRSEEHTSELQSLMRISYAVSCVKKKK